MGGRGDSGDRGEAVLGLFISGKTVFEIFSCGKTTNYNGPQNGPQQAENGDEGNQYKSQEDDKSHNNTKGFGIEF